MEHYIKQLIEDIRKASLSVRPPHPLWPESQADPDNEAELEDMSYVEEFLYGEKQPVSFITGIEAHLLPPPEKLNETQQAWLATELEKLLQFFHFYPDFPVAFPAHLRYPFIRNLWNESHVPLSFGENHIEFCEYEEENCPFPGYCSTCRDVIEEMKSDETRAKEEETELDNECGWDGNSAASDDYDMASDFTGGLFNDDGTPVDPDSISIPGLCIICKNYQIDDQEENLLCLMNRYDQRNNPHFQCGAYVKI